MQSRPLFVHVHVPKCGGTSLNILLEKWFGAAFRYCYGSDPEKTLSIEEMEGFVRANQSIDCFASHDIRHFPSTINNRPALYITFLRDPADRLISCAKHLVQEFSSLSDCHQSLVPTNQPDRTVFGILSKWIEEAPAKLQVDPLSTSSLAAFFYSAALTTTEPFLNRYRSNWRREEDGSFAKQLAVSLALSELRHFFFVGRFACFEQEVERLGRLLAKMGYSCPVDSVPNARHSHPAIELKTSERQFVNQKLRQLCEMDFWFYEEITQAQLSTIHDLEPAGRESSRSNR
jgi:hypothetical protein